MSHRIGQLIFLISILTVGFAFSQTNFVVGDTCPGQGPTLMVRYDLLQTGPVELVVQHLFTKIHVRTLVTGVMQAGQYSIAWDGLDDQGQPLETGIYVFILRGADWSVEQWGAINCGNDAAIPSRVVVGGRDVSMTFVATVSSETPVEMAVYDTDFHLVADFSPTSPANTVLLWWALEDSLRNPVPAGDYVFRVASPEYSEDIPFTLNPIDRGSLTVAITDADGQRALGAESGAGDVPLIKGPLQQIEVDFGRRFSAPEMEYMLGNGLECDGAFEYVRPDSVTVLPDSTGMVFTSFDLSRPWPDIFGLGVFRGYGLFTSAASVFKLGFDHQGITRRAPDCLVTGPVDPTDWTVHPGPFYTTPQGTVDPPCGNPILVDQVADIYFNLFESGTVIMNLINSEGDLVRRLVAGELSAGAHRITWDRRDDAGVEVPEGIYHLIWHGYDVDRLASVTSGDIVVSSSLAPVPDAVAVPMAPTLSPNHPNPFNPRTTIGITLSAPGFARLTILSVDGRRVATLVEGELAAGQHAVTWDGRDMNGRPVPSGTYFYQLQADGIALTRRMVLLK